MVRSFFSSRISVGTGRRYRRRINIVRNVSRSNRAALRCDNDESNASNDGSKQQVGEGYNGESSGRVYEVFDVCDRSPDSKEHYKVRWKGYPQRKYDTYEPASRLRSIGLGEKLKEIDAFIIWRERRMLENPELKRVPTIYNYRKMKGKPIYTANEDYTCVLVALNNMTNLLKVKFVFDSKIKCKFGGDKGFKYSKLRKMIAHQQKILKRNFLSLEGARHNRTKKCRKDTKSLLASLSKESGVFLCGAGNITGLYHAFVLLVRESRIYLFDEAFNVGNKLLSIDDLSWVSTWKFILKGTREDGFSTEF